MMKNRPIALVLASVLVAGCAGNAAMQRADLEVERGNLDTAIAYYQEILGDDPTNVDAKIRLAHLKVEASQAHEAQGRKLRDEGDLEQAALELQLAILLDPGNEVAADILSAVQQELIERRRQLENEQTLTERLLQEARDAESVLPELQPEVTGPITFDFRDVEVTEIYRTLAQVAGLNVLFESTLGSDITTFQVEGADFYEALNLLTQSQGHFYKALSSNTFLVIPDDVTKRREYADQILRTFFLSNADVATVEQQIRALLQTTFVTSNADLNTISVRETPEAMKIVEKLVATADKSVGEILLEVEVLEVSSEVVSNYGLALEPFGGQVNVFPQATTESGDVLGRSIKSLGSLNSAEIFVTIPTLFYQFLRTTNSFKLVAQPKLRATEGQTTQLLIGEQVPVVTTTFNPGSTIGGNVVPISSTEYRDTGILLSVTPRVHFNGEITLEIDIQVSAVTATATIASVGDLPVFTTRQVTGSIRLRDGETNVIAGLLQDNDIRSRRGVIGLDNVPVAGDIFSGTEDTKDQTDVVISITPHILRGPDLKAEDLESMYVGTAAGVTGSRGFAGGGAAGARGAGGTTNAAGAGGGEDPAVLALLPAQHVVEVDEEFAIDVTVDRAQELFSAGIEVRYDASIVAYVDYFEGGFMDQDGAELSVQVANAGPGILRMGMARMGTDQGISGSGSLVTLVFRGVAPGSSSIDITASTLRNLPGRTLPTQMLPASVEVRERRE